jgi:hypothetical protein
MREQLKVGYRGRLGNGAVFQWIPASAEGLGCALGFVRDERRRERCEQQLSQNRLSSYLNGVGLFASYTGHYELAQRYYREGNDIVRELEPASGLLSSTRSI